VYFLGDVLADRHTQTDIHITILRSPNGTGVVRLNQYLFIGLGTMEAVVFALLIILNVVFLTTDCTVISYKP